MTSHDLARVERPGALAPVDAFSGFRLLDRYADDGVATPSDRVTWIATISAGYLTQNARGIAYPRASKKGDAKWIHLRPGDEERAPGLVKALEEGAWRSLTIAMPWDDPRLCIRQHFEERSSGRLITYGDDRSLTFIELRNTGKKDRNGDPIEEGVHHTYLAGSPEYRQAMDRCKVSTDVFFWLARWKGLEPKVVWPDGMGVYRLTFTSRNSARSFESELRGLASLTGGRLQGLPLELSLDFREAVDGLGKRREICVWTPRLKPPTTMELTPAVWHDLATKALAQARAVYILPPATPTYEELDADGGEPDLDLPAPRDLEIVQQGGLCDADFYKSAWFARVKGTSLDSDRARERFIAAYAGTTGSLADFLANATEADAAALLAKAGEHVAREQATAHTAQQARRYEDIFGGGEDDAARARAAKPAQVSEDPRGSELPSARATEGVAPAPGRQRQETAPRGAQPVTPPATPPEGHRDVEPSAPAVSTPATQEASRALVEATWGPKPTEPEPDLADPDDGIDWDERAEIADAVAEEPAAEIVRDPADPDWQEYTQVYRQVSTKHGSVPPDCKLSPPPATPQRRDVIRATIAALVARLAEPVAPPATKPRPSFGSRGQG